MFIPENVWKPDSGKDIESCLKYVNTKSWSAFRVKLQGSKKGVSRFQSIPLIVYGLTLVDQAQN
jgi:hypothetical protein